MMTCSNSSSDVNSALVPALSGSIVAHFVPGHGAGQSFFIVPLEQDVSGTALPWIQALKAAFPESEIANCLEIGRFEVKGQLCALLQSLPPQPSPAPTQRLTNREREIIELVALGRSNKQIARQLQLSEWTVATHLRRVFTKLGVGSRAEMVYRCISDLNPALGTAS